MKLNEMWLAPKESKDYFSPEAGKKSKEKYGIWAAIHTIIGIIILLLPSVIVFTLFVPENALNPTTSLGNILGGIGGVLGIIGSLAIGIGLVNLFSLLIKQYLGHLVTLISIASGFLLIALSISIFSFIK